MSRAPQAGRGFVLALANGRRIESSWKFAEADLLRSPRVWTGGHPQKGYFCAAASIASSSLPASAHLPCAASSRARRRWFWIDSFKRLSSAGGVTPAEAEVAASTG